MSKYWTNTTFGQVTELQQGMCFNKKSNHLLREDGIPVLLIKDLKNNTISQYTDTELTPKRFISKDTDIIYTRTGQVGLVFTNKIGVIHNNSFKISPNKDVYPLFLYWYLKQPSMIKYANNIAGGSAQPDLGHDAFKSMSFKYPDIKTQKKIVSILSSYDKLIENNTRRIQILEEMAQRIYKEWFVDFKYPGHENDELEDSELGMIPQGWEISNIKDVVNKVVLGGTPARKNEKFWNGKIPWIKSGKLNDLRVLEGTEYITELGLEKSATKLMPPRTVLISITGAIIISLSEIELCANQSVIGLYDSSILSQEYIYLNQQINIHQYTSKMSGSAQQHINKDIVQNTKILVPRVNILNDFDKLIKPLFNQISSLLFKNKKLTITRDYLLLKLISGKVDVFDLDIDTCILDE